MKHKLENRKIYDKEIYQRPNQVDRYIYDRRNPDIPTSKTCLFGISSFALEFVYAKEISTSTYSADDIEVDMYVDNEFVGHYSQADAEGDIIPDMEIKCPSTVRLEISGSYILPNQSISIYVTSDFHEDEHIISYTQLRKLRFHPATYTNESVSVPMIGNSEFGIILNGESEPDDAIENNYFGLFDDSGNPINEQFLYIPDDNPVNIAFIDNGTTDTNSAFFMDGCEDTTYMEGWGVVSQLYLNPTEFEFDEEGAIETSVFIPSISFSGDITSELAAIHNYTITSGGTNYEVGDIIDLVPSDQNNTYGSEMALQFEVSDVENGAVTGGNLLFPYTFREEYDETAGQYVCRDMNYTDSEGQFQLTGAIGEPYKEEVPEEYSYNINHILMSRINVETEPEWYGHVSVCEVNDGEEQEIASFDLDSETPGFNLTSLESALVVYLTGDWLVGGQYQTSISPESTEIYIPHESLSGITFEYKPRIANTFMSGTNGAVPTTEINGPDTGFGDSFYIACQNGDGEFVSFDTCEPSDVRGLTLYVPNAGNYSLSAFMVDPIENPDWDYHFHDMSGTAQQGVLSDILGNEVGEGFYAPVYMADEEDNISQAIISFSGSEEEHQSSASDGRFVYYGGYPSIWVGCDSPEDGGANYSVGDLIEIPYMNLSDTTPMPIAGGYCKVETVDENGRILSLVTEDIVDHSFGCASSKNTGQFTFTDNSRDNPEDNATLSVLFSGE